jgi:hypothetical protein
MTDWLPHDGGPMPVALTYTNWRGETAVRTILPMSVWYGATKWHPEPQWLLKAVDVHRGAERDFALADFGRIVTPAPDPRDSLQDRVAPWMLACFGAEVSADRLERGDRLLEEVFELLQSGDYPRERVASLSSYVWSRDIGEPHQEVGGVMITLAAYCLAHGLDMHKAGEDELARIWTKVEKIRAKQAAKPKGSALPQVWNVLDPRDAEIARLTQERDLARTTANDQAWKRIAAEAEVARLTAEVERMREALKFAEEALGEYACHVGPSAPCIRHPEQCVAECGRFAGDALLKVRAALQGATP